MMYMLMDAEMENPGSTKIRNNDSRGKFSDPFCRKNRFLAIEREIHIIKD